VPELFNLDRPSRFEQLAQDRTVAGWSSSSSHARGGKRAPRATALRWYAMPPPSTAVSMATHMCDEPRSYIASALVSSNHLRRGIAQAAAPRQTPGTATATQVRGVGEVDRLGIEPRAAFPGFVFFSLFFLF
jgi:hypothetical protein